MICSLRLSTSYMNLQCKTETMYLVVEDTVVLSIMIHVNICHVFTILSVQGLPFTSISTTAPCSSVYNLFQNLFWYTFANNHNFKHWEKNVNLSNIHVFLRSNGFNWIIR